jgi:Flp pilus assembly protein TadG
MSIRRDQRGETLIEFALAATLLLSLIFGIISLGIAAWRYNMVSDLAQEGARWASVRGKSSAALSHATQSDVQTYVNSRAAGLTITVNTYAVDTTTKSCTTTTVNPGTLAAGTGFCVNAQNTYRVLAGLVPGPTLTLQSTSQMIIAR